MNGCALALHRGSAKPEGEHQLRLESHTWCPDFFAIGQNRDVTIPGVALPHYGPEKMTVLYVTAKLFFF